MWALSRRNLSCLPKRFGRTSLSARSDVDDEEIFRIAKEAAIHDVIMKFEKGYDTLVGERGVSVSGGQRQRIAIARALITDSPILIFDDSLSAVDTETDLAIRQALRSRAPEPLHSSSHTASRACAAPT